MVAIQTPVRARYWKKYKSIVLIPRREERRKELVREFQKALGVSSLAELSGTVLFGRLKVSIFGEQVEFEVVVKVYAWVMTVVGREAGLELFFVVVNDDCLECMMRVLRAINMFGGVKGSLTLTIPGGEND